MSDGAKSRPLADALDAAGRRMIDALPGIIEALVKRAEGGDVKAAVALLDRIMGKPGAGLGDHEPSGEIRPRIIIPGSDDRLCRMDPSGASEEV